MVPIAEIIKEGVRLFGSGLGTFLSIDAMKKKQRLEKERLKMRRRFLEQQMKEEDEDYARSINEDAMYRYTSQYNANKLSEALRDQLKNTRGRQAVMGGTDEQIAEQMKNNANAMSDYYGQVEMLSEEEKKQLKKEHKQRKKELAASALDVADAEIASKINTYTERNAALANAIAGVTNSASQIGSNFSASNMTPATRVTQSGNTVNTPYGAMTRAQANNVQQIPIGYKGNQPIDLSTTPYGAGMKAEKPKMPVPLLDDFYPKRNYLS